MRFGQAYLALEKGELSPVYTLLGQDGALVDAWIERVYQKLTEKNQVMRLDIQFDEQGIDEILMAVDSPSLFGDRTLAVIRHFTGMQSGGKSKWDFTELETYLESPSHHAHLILCVDADKLDERRKLSKLLKRYPMIQCYTEKSSERIELARILDERARQLDHQVAQDLAERVESVGQFIRELDKIFTFSHHHPITMEILAELAVPRLEDNLFAFVSAVWSGHLSKAWAIRQELAQRGIDEFSLLGILARQIRLMWYAKVVGTSKKAATELGVHPFALSKAGEEAVYWDRKKLESCLVSIADAEYFVKSGRWEAEGALLWVVSSLTVSVGQIKQPYNRAQ
ncbi:DNA polymerase III subunit delta [Alicyclobacillus sp. TC]|uniref:DNA polymerase III subunit delta n=1 Tax=Alicyclobacillus sp. TC TaxID=2606450 RepID=UPI001931667D|nr:DNA polymerase III subunit delta [Alicyclobacillus sp. TC]QRF23100.1 DNA polymerase III subunit delta [Alicyclobacillus sp. TC]